ncbi:MAG: hypothetical protein JWP29_4913 [Rhodoferax sp.]|nr:hypothetical protein [Rhodoferax sp.]
MRAPPLLMPLLTTRWGRAACIAVLLTVAYDRADAATPATEAVSAEASVWQTVSEARLDTLRGGFDAGGLLVSFGITRAVYVNGALLTETTLNLGQLAQLSPAQAMQLSGQIAGLNLVKIGPGNTAALEGALLPSAVAGALPGVIVQNTLNNQNINVQTMINATSNGLGILRSMNSMRTLNDGMR